eukprot:6293628-Amphidinium_carterae.1
MSEEVNAIPIDKTPLTFNAAANVLETWIQKYEVARKYGAHIEPQKMIAIIQRVVDVVRTSGKSSAGEPDQVFIMDYYDQFNKLGIRDSPTHDRLEMLAKQVFATLRNRSREVATSRVTMKTTMTNKERTSALAAGADNRQETEQERKERYAKMVCKFFASEDGCKKGKSCEARHVAKEKGCKICGSHKHHASKCDRTQPSKPKADGKKPARRDGKPGAHAADGKNRSKKDKDKRKDKKTSKDKPKKTFKKPSGPRAREATLEQEGGAGDSDKEQTSPEQTSEEEVTDSEAELEEGSEASEDDSDTPSSTGAMAILKSEEDSEDSPRAFATKTNMTPMFLDPADKAYALVDSGATHVILNLKHLPAELKSEATLVEMTLASGKVDAYLFLDEVFAKDVKTPLCPLRLITTKLDISIEWTKDHCLMVLQGVTLMRMTVKKGLHYLTELQFAMVRRALRDQREDLTD